MSRAHTNWTDRFSAYLADELPAAERGEVESHLDGCGACRRVLAELRAVVDAAAALGDREPPRDLWPAIAEAISAPVEAEATVIALSSARDGRATLPGRFSFTGPQLAAAAVVLVTLSSVATWWAGPGLGVRVDSAASLPAATELRTVASVPAPPVELSAELAELEEALASAGADLDPNTVRVIERNLGVIEQAIADSYQALELDPENEFLADHLRRVYQRKLTYLRDAVRVLAWEG